jgi:hypothetical protein
MDKLGRRSKSATFDSGAFGPVLQPGKHQRQAQGRIAAGPGLLIGTSGSSGQTTYSRLLYRVGKGKRKRKSASRSIRTKFTAAKRHELPAADRVNFLVAFAKVKLFGEIAAPRANGAPDDFFPCPTKLR